MDGMRRLGIAGSIGTAGSNCLKPRFAEEIRNKFCVYEISTGLNLKSSHLTPQGVRIRL